MLKPLEVLAQNGVVIKLGFSQVRPSLPVGDARNIVVHDLGSNLYFIGPGCSNSLDYFTACQIKPKANRVIDIVDETEGTLSLIVQENGESWEYRLFKTWPAFNIALRENNAKFFGSVSLEEYQKFISPKNESK